MNEPSVPERKEIAAWNPATRFAFRFAFAYSILYLLPFPLDGIPKLDIAARHYEEFWRQAVPWVGRNILGLNREITDVPTGSGDTTFNFVQLLCFVALALLAAGLWSILDRRRTSYPRLHEWLRIYVRFAVGLIVFGYGFAKVVNTQFPYPDLDRYVQPVGNLSPMGLLWTFMGASPAYCTFTGLAECIGGFLLLWRRTTTLGALIVAGVMVNVVMLNYCYDVPVKLYSTHLLLFSLFLLVPDMHRLLSFFVLNRATSAASLGRPFANRWLNRAALAIKILFLGWAVGFTVYDGIEFVRFQVEPSLPAFYGLYEVDSFARNGSSAAALETEKNQWRRVTFNRMGRMAVLLMDDSLQRYLVRDMTDEKKLELTPRWEPEKKTTLVYERHGDDRLVLKGNFFGEELKVSLRRVHDPQFLLPTRGFHWINEKPFNR